MAEKRGMSGQNSDKKRGGKITLLSKIIFMNAVKMSENMEILCRVMTHVRHRQHQTLLLTDLVTLP